MGVSTDVVLGETRHRVPGGSRGPQDANVELSSDDGEGHELLVEEGVLIRVGVEERRSGVGVEEGRDGSVGLAELGLFVAQSDGLAGQDLAGLGGDGGG